MPTDEDVREVYQILGVWEEKQRRSFQFQDLKVLSSGGFASYPYVACKFSKEDSQVVEHA